MDNEWAMRNEWFHEFALKKMSGKVKPPLTLYLNPRIILLRIRFPAA
jgi:hypothetical protein